MRHRDLVEEIVNHLFRKVDVRLPGKSKFTLPWREADSPDRHDDIVDSDQ